MWLFLHELGRVLNLTLFTSLSPCTPLWLMKTHDLCLSQQGPQRSSLGLRKAWRKEKEEKKSFFPSYWVQTRDGCKGGGSRASIRDTYCPSGCKGRGASEQHLYGVEDRGISGREIWIAAGLRHNESVCDKEPLWYGCCGQELDISSPWWLHCMYRAH